jgi:beta-glucosidase
LFGNYNPAGRLPITFYQSTRDLPAFDDYSMANRTYRYFTGKPEFPFGYGLSYTTFKYENLKLAADNLRADGTVKLTLDLSNSGTRDGDEVVQVYAHATRIASPESRLIRQLVAFKRVNLPAGTSKQISLESPLKEFRHWNVDRKQYEVTPGDYEIETGGSSANLPVKATLHVLSPG